MKVASFKVSEGDIVVGDGEALGRDDFRLYTHRFTAPGRYRLWISVETGLYFGLRSVVRNGQTSILGGSGAIPMVAFQPPHVLQIDAEPGDVFEIGIQRTAQGGLIPFEAKLTPRPLLTDEPAVVVL